MSHQLITKPMLMHAMDVQSISGKQLGTVLVDLGYATQEAITLALAKQYQLDTIEKTKCINLPYQTVERMTWLHYNALIQSQNYLINLKGNDLTIAIHDPSNELAIEQVLHWATPYNVVFVLIKS